MRGAHLRNHVLEKEERAVVHAWGARAEASAEAEGIVLVLDVFLLLLPLHAEGGIGEHVVERPFLAVWRPVETVLGERVAENNVVGVFDFDEHVGLADGPGFVVPVLAEKLGLGVGIEVADVFLRDRQHATRAACGVVDGLDDVTAGKVFLRREEKIDHELDDLARREVFSRFLIGLFRADPDEFLEDIPHLHGIHTVRREINLRVDKGLDDKIEQILLGHIGDLFAELEPLHNGADVGRKPVDVAVEIRREVVRIVEEAIEPAAFFRFRHRELGQVVEGYFGDVGQPVPDDIFALRLDGGMLFQYLRFRRSKNAVEATQDRKR